MATNGNQNNFGGTKCPTICGPNLSLYPEATAPIAIATIINIITEVHDLQSDTSFTAYIDNLRTVNHLQDPTKCLPFSTPYYETFAQVHYEINNMKAKPRWRWIQSHNETTSTEGHLNDYIYHHSKLYRSYSSPIPIWVPFPAGKATVYMDQLPIHNDIPNSMIKHTAYKKSTKFLCEKWNWSDETYSVINWEAFTCV